ncbi:hypothetical protein CONCODRAFT_12334 [Conidiobolus coronatus NRRL 28638]|uniref:Chaplin domain-containing protein n=1 Tax=Conidiobolus coronatus (strain ATCC 28846 / CBS 209.66 / NRRL 28638) TaxID=796925 RepID=A0A137NTD8_CONC2|nr:hypothetical protein CONCODRAFT_12334 [Conidiobolus coronatus NRRL 28638]|eukprot:KXN65948.1 hypothetical protein CONCODRAFT_12334 [Conidiobolus coronatus NRRL 28638]
MQLFYFAALISFLAASPYDGTDDFKAHGDIAGNTVDAPIHAPKNNCNNGAKVIGAHGTSFDNSCENTSVESDTDAHTRNGHGHGHALFQLASSLPIVDSADDTFISFLSGNNISAPISMNRNICNNKVKVVNSDHTSFDNSCTNTSVESNTDSHNRGFWGFRGARDD